MIIAARSALVPQLQRRKSIPGGSSSGAAGVYGAYKRRNRCHSPGPRERRPRAPSPPRPPVTPATVPAARRPPPGSLHLQPVVRKAFPAEPAPPDHKSEGQPCPAAPSGPRRPPRGGSTHPAGPPQLRADEGCQPGRTGRPPASAPSGRLAALTLNDILHMSAAAAGPRASGLDACTAHTSLALPPPSAEGRPPRRRALHRRRPGRAGCGRRGWEGKEEGWEEGRRGGEGAEEGEREGAPPQTTLSYPPTLPSPPHPHPHACHTSTSNSARTVHTLHTQTRFMHAPLHTHNLTSSAHPDSLTLSLQTEHPTLCTLSSLHTHTTLATCSTLAGNPALLLTYPIHDKAGLAPTVPFIHKRKNHINVSKVV